VARSLMNTTKLLGDAASFNSSLDGRIEKSSTAVIALGTPSE
jgi:hypothetical protein